MKQNFNEVIEILKKEGLSDKQIGEFIVNLNNALSGHLYLILVESLSEEDMQKLNTVSDDVQRETQMRQIFEQKTGKDLKELSDTFIQTFTRDFLEGYQQISLT